MKDFTELTDTTSTGVNTWVPEDVYADMVLDGLVCYGQLSGVVTSMEYDFTAGGGDTIQVRYVSPRTHSCTSLGKNCNCLSATSTTFGTYDIPVRPWGDYDLICGFSIWAAKGNIVSKVLNEMSKRMAKCRDAEIWSELTSGFGVPASIVASSVSCSDSKGIGGSCCTYSFNLYNSVVSLMKEMQGRSYEPDYVIMHPEVAAYLYFKDGTGYPIGVMPGTTFSSDGKLLTIAGLKVIECCNANRCNNIGGTDELNTFDVIDGSVQAVVIDSSRAIGEVWGKRPTFSEFYENDCDRYKYVLWQYWGCSELDTGAIGWVVNP